jgi:putative SOS response-associated peptidase YedK
MCGRYGRTSSEEELCRIYNIPIPPQLDLPVSYDIAPSEKVLAIRFNHKAGQRSLDALQWGLMPHWAKDPKIAYKTINARVETVDTAPPYRQTFEKRRCLIPADSFYEWKKVVGGKISYAIGMKDDAPFVFAGLWEGWKDPDGCVPVRSSPVNPMSSCVRAIPECRESCPKSITMVGYPVKLEKRF